jgi:hypothetical protein
MHIGQVQDTQRRTLEAVDAGLLRAHCIQAALNERAPRERATGNQAEPDADGARGTCHE